MMDKLSRRRGEGQRFLWFVSGELKVESLLRLDLHFGCFPRGFFIVVSFVRRREVLYCC